jgi:hypothetical protein
MFGAITCSIHASARTTGVGRKRLNGVLWMVFLLALLFQAATAVRAVLIDKVRDEAGARQVTAGSGHTMDPEYRVLMARADSIDATWNSVALMIVGRSGVIAIGLALVGAFGIGLGSDRCRSTEP